MASIADYFPNAGKTTSPNTVSPGNSSVPYSTSYLLSQAAGGNPINSGNAINRLSGVATPSAPPSLTDSTDSTSEADALLKAQLAAQAKAAADAKANADAQARRDIGLQQSYLGGAQTEFDTAKASNQSRLQQVLDRYTGETTRNQGVFDEQSGVNQGNYNRNLQEAMVNAARGRQGLFGTLSALGALSGSGITLADQAVQQGANLDIAGADETYRDNQSGLTQAFDEYKEQNTARTEDAQYQAGALNQQAQNNYYKTQQEIFVKMANLYNALGDSGQADNYTRQASALANRIGASGVSPVGSISPTAASFTPEALGNYVSGPNDVSVTQSAPSGAALVPSLLATIRRREQGV